jgi:L-alanine-DL-glutamate epimerase-like enolase superfamily enzyme
MIVPQASISNAAAVETVRASAYTVPTDLPESDGTLAWKKTTVVVVETWAADAHGLGFTYADPATAQLINDLVAETVQGRDAMDTPGCWEAMVHAIRNLGRPGISSMAIAAVDFSLWDLKAKLLGLPLVKLLGRVREGVPVYGSGGFTSYSGEQLIDQLGSWAARGIGRVKMKVGRSPSNDLDRVRAARRAIGEHTELFVDANGAYSRKEALDFANRFRECGVSWFEEPVSSDDLEGLRLLRDRGPSGMDVAAGEYGYDLPYFRRMLEAGSVDVLQADASRCAGITGFLGVAALCEARSLPLSAHTAPSLHLALGCAVRPLRHLEYFHDHVRIERMLFDGAVEPQSGVLYPDLTRPGLGLELRKSDAEPYAA